MSKLTCAAMTSALLKMGPILKRKSGKGKLEGASVSAIESVKTEPQKGNDANSHF